MRKRVKIISRFGMLLLLTGLIVSLFSWVGLLIDLSAFLLLIYVSKWLKISWFKIFFYTIALVMIIFPLLMKYHTSKIKYIAVDWRLLPSAEKVYIDPLYQQRMMNYNFDSLMLSNEQLKNLRLFDSDTDVVPAPAPAE